MTATITPPEPDTTSTPTSEDVVYDRVTADLERRSHSRRLIVEGVLFLVLAVGGGLLLWGAHFANNMVHQQLSDQKIYFPAKDSKGFDAATYPGLQQYAGQQLTTGPQAKAYADEYIKVHLSEVANGQTYSQVSTAARQNPNDAKLQNQVQTLFRGETLRGLLLNAWGWSVIAAIAFWTGIGAAAGALVVLIAIVYGVVRPEHA